jgi:hypothetical protein
MRVTTGLTAPLSLRRAGDESLPLRVDPEPGRFEDRDPQQRFFFLPGEHQSAPGRLAEHFDYAETNRQLLFGPIGKFIGAPVGRLDAEFRSTLAGRNVSVAPVSTSTRPVHDLDDPARGRTVTSE